MYQLFSKISNLISAPFGNVAYSTNIALIAALFFGFVGSVAPCQISANIGAITYFGNRQMQAKLSWVEITWYMLGKIMVFSIFGLFFWLFGRSISNESIPIFVYARKFLGPLLVLIGLFLLGWVKLPSLGYQLSALFMNWSQKFGRKGGAFLMGMAFSLGFCPTMFALFFGSVMPMVLSSSYGFLLPPVFAIGTAMPLLLFAGLVIGFGMDQMMVRKAKQWGRWIQILAGLLFIVLGISDTITYWTL